jgi:UDP-glucose:(heptosyl)LPS alpha-1,3-glucosyltransferase
MKIALVVHDLHEHGGHSLYTKVLADELSLRHEVAVFANRCEGCVDARWDFHQVRASRFNALLSIHSFPLGLRTQSSLLAKFDIRHTQGYCGGRPNVVTAHICVAAYLNSLRSVSLRTRASVKSMAVAESRFYRRHKGYVIAVSHKVAAELQEFYEISGPIKVISHGVHGARFSSSNREHLRSIVRNELGIDRERTVALYVGDLTKAHTQLKALATIAPDVLFIVVSRSRQYRWRGPNVRFLAPTTEIERYYAASDALVFPTTYDAFGMVVLEAMASGLPVFSSDQAGAAELIEHGRDGFVFSLDDWVEATAGRLRDRDSLRTVGRNAEKTASRHDWSTVVRKVEEVYGTIAVA